MFSWGPNVRQQGFESGCESTREVRRTQQDTAHGAHDTNDEWMMYWTVNQASSVALLGGAIGAGGDTVAPFDQSCINDLIAADK